MSLRLAVIGKTGQLGQALLREGEDLGHQIIALDREALDLTASPKQIKAAIAGLPSGLDGLILAAAYTDVDGAETNADLAYAINSTAPAAIAMACAQHDIPMIHISTDYVFDGEADQPYSPDDDTDPLGVYGASKLDGELAVINSGARALILRTSWVFDAINKNFLTTMIKLAKTRDEVSVVDDQIGRPTYAGHLAQAVLKAAQGLAEEPDLETGVYHITGGGEEVTWAGFAKAIFQTVGSNTHVDEIPTSDYPTPAERPQYSVLDTDRFERTFRHPLPEWQAGLRAALDERDENN
jgi:dTDP-4-dehydrorhamnose reductase